MLLLYLFAIIGLTNIVVDSYLFEPVRESFKDREFIYHGINCKMCMGFWSGMFIGLLILLAKHLDILWLVIYGFAGSAVAMLFNDLQQLIQSYDKK